MQIHLSFFAVFIILIVSHGRKIELVKCKNIINWKGSKEISISDHQVIKTEQHKFFITSSTEWNFCKVATDFAAPRAEMAQPRVGF
jgi:hypothetical protein